LAIAATAIAALVAGLLVAGAHDAYPTTRVVQTSGLVWVASDQIGSLTLLDGVAGQAVVDIPAAQVDGDSLLVGQDAATGFAFDQAAGRLTRIDGSTYAPLTAQEPFTSTNTGLQFLVGTRVAYIVDGDKGSVSAYDLATLQQVGDTRHFAHGASNDTAIVDSSSRLWVLNQSTGRLSWFTANDSGQSAETFTRGAATLVLADGEPVVVDTGTHRAYLIAFDGSASTSLIVGADSLTGARFSGATAQSELVMANSTLGTYRSCSIAVGTCGKTLRVRFAGDMLGPAVTADGRTFVPDYTTGTAWVLDPSGATPPVNTGNITAPGSFDLLDHNGLIFYNDPHTNQAGIIDTDGTPTPIVKYSSAGTTGGPSESASETTTTTPTVSAQPTPTSATPTHSASGPTPGPSGKPVPTPTPSNTGGSPTYCAESTPSPSQATPEQGGIPVSESERSVAEKPGPAEDKKQPWSAAKITFVTAIVTAVIGGVFAVLAAVAPDLFFPQASASASSTPPSTRDFPSTKSTTPVSVYVPATPEFTLQDPGGAGVYGLAFTSDGSLAVGDYNGSSYLWDVAEDKVAATLSDVSGQAIFGLSYTPHGSILAASTFNAPVYDKGSVVLWNASTGKLITTLLDPHGTGIGNSAAFNPDGTTLAVDDSNSYIYLWNTVTDKLTNTLHDPGGELDSGIVFSPNTGLLVDADSNGTAYMWNIQNSSVVKTFQDPNSKGATSLAFSPNGSILAVGDKNGNVYLWNPTTGGLITTLDGLPGGSVEAVAFSPRTGVLAATLDDDKTQTYEICAWSTSGKLLATLHNPGSVGVTAVAFSPDGDTLVVGDENAHSYLWNVNGLYS
jgi:Anaphase-promoting complex subunit 4 WD40 domain/WD domain, G-beta repeat